MEEKTPLIDTDKKQAMKEYMRNYAREWRDENPNYLKNYYQQNREKILGMVCAKKHCDICNKGVSKMSRHIKTNKHIKLQKQLNDIIDV